MLLARAILEARRPALAASCSRRTTRSTSAPTSSTRSSCRNGIWWLRQQQRDPQRFLEGAEQARRRILTGELSRATSCSSSRRCSTTSASRRSSCAPAPCWRTTSATPSPASTRASSAPTRARASKRLEDFLAAVRTIYASTMSEKALRYRAQRGLLDQDEQMALLVQRVSGDVYGRLLLPAGRRRRLLVQPLRLEPRHRPEGGRAAAGLRPGHARRGPVRRRLHAGGGPERPDAPARARLRRGPRSTRSAGSTSSTWRPTSSSRATSPTSPPARRTCPWTSSLTARPLGASTAQGRPVEVPGPDLRRAAHGHRLRRGHARDAARPRRRPTSTPWTSSSRPTSPEGRQLPDQPGAVPAAAGAGQREHRAAAGRRSSPRTASWRPQAPSSATAATSASTGSSTSCPRSTAACPSRRATRWPG